MQDLLPYVCNACPRFCQLLGEIYTECGADWHVILYCDGLTPGSVLAPENQRKSIIWYATILEFGSKLCHQELWFCLASIETAVSKLASSVVWPDPTCCEGHGLWRSSHEHSRHHLACGQGAAA